MFRRYLFIITLEVLPVTPVGFHGFVFVSEKILLKTLDIFCNML